MRKLFISALSLMLSITAIAQLKLDADIRTRGEIRNGYMSPAVENATSAFLTTQRSRINMFFEKEKFTMKFGVQDVRVWGENDVYNASGSYYDSGSLSVAESWAKYHFTDSFSVKVGRQALAYDEQRLLSTRDWSQSSLFYDATLLSYLKKNWQVDLGLTFNNTAEVLYNIDYPSDMNRFQTLDFLYVKNKLSNKMDISALVISVGYNDVLKPNMLHWMHTAGANYNLNLGKSKIHLEGYYQFGHNNTAQKVDAYFLTANTSYDLSSKLTAGVGYDYYAGHDASNTDAEYQATDHSFDILYGARFKFNGNMNQFTFVGKAYEKAGLQDINAMLTYKHDKKHSLKTEAHLFALAEDYLVKNVEVDKNLGWEIDAVYNYKFNSFSKLSIGAGYFGANSSLYSIKGMNTDKMGENFFGWMSLQFTPELFNSKKSNN